MKHYILIGIMLVAITNIASAHPPMDIIAEYDTTNKVLQITVNHQVKDTQRHYINKVEIEINGNEIIEQKSSQQIDNTNQRYLYIIPEPGVEDTISIEAYCNISGKKKLKTQINQIIKE